VSRASYILASIVSLMLLAFAFYVYIQAWKLVRETTDWISYMNNIVISCMLLLLFTVLAFVGVSLIAVILHHQD